jgi:hypothetical protein
MSLGTNCTPKFGLAQRELFIITKCYPENQPSFGFIHQTINGIEKKHGKQDIH